MVFAEASGASSVKGKTSKPGVSKNLTAKGVIALTSTVSAHAEKEQFLTKRSKKNPKKKQQIWYT